MSSQFDQIRDQQHETWNRLSAGLREDSCALDDAAGTGEPSLTAAARTRRGAIMMTDLSERMLEVAAETA